MKDLIVTHITDEDNFSLTLHTSDVHTHAYFGNHPEEWYNIIQATRGALRTIAQEEAKRRKTEAAASAQSVSLGIPQQEVLPY